MKKSNKKIIKKTQGYLVVVRMFPEIYQFKTLADAHAFMNDVESIGGECAITSKVPAEYMRIVRKAGRKKP